MVTIKKYFRLLCLLPIVGMSVIAISCSDDRVIEDIAHVTGVEEYPLEGCFAVSVNTGSSSRSSRAESFENGDDDEYAIASTGSHHFLILYESGNSNKTTPKAVITLKDFTEVQHNPDGNNVTLKASSIVTDFVNANGEKIFKVDDIKALLQGKVSQVIINTDYTAAQLMELTQETLFNISVEKPYITINGVNYFTMANATYINANNAVVRRGEIYPAKIYDNDADALANPAVTANVERMAVKYSMDFTPLRLSDYVYTPSGGKSVDLYVGLEDYADSYTIESRPAPYKIEILGYGTNALEPRERIFKKVDAKEYYAGWNELSNKRCYWADDINYNITSENGSTKYAEKYPHQYRKALETDTVRNYHDQTDYNSDGSLKLNTTNEGFFLNYVSFNDITRGAGRTNRPTKFYSNENTYYDRGISHKNSDGMETGTLWERGCFSAGTHILIACKLTIEDDDYRDASDLYYGQNEIFYKDASQIIEAKLRLFNQIILPGGTSGIRILSADWMGHTAHKQYNSDVSNSDIGSHLINVGWDMNSLLWVGEPGHPESAHLVMPSDLTLIPAEVSGGDGKLLIAPSADNKSKQFWLGPASSDNPDMMDVSVKNTYETEGGEIVSTYYYQPISYNELVSLFHKLIGAIEHFKNGYMYYAVPVVHHGVTDGVTPSWMTEGYYGAVRNHWYEIVINSINNIGTPVDDPAQPIIPRLEARREYLNVTVKVLDWHTITENVPFVPWN